MSERQQKFKVFLPLLFSITLILGMFLGFKLRDHQGYKKTYFLDTRKADALQEMLNLTKLKYVDSINPTALKDDAISGILSHLDPHSVYIPPSELAAVNEDLDANFQGIGIAFVILGDTINITDVIAGTPAMQAGLQPGDKVLKVDDSVVAGVHITQDRIKSLVRGPKGSKVKVQILREGRKILFELKRGIIPLHSIDAAYMLRPGLGYIRINRFSSGTYGEFMDAMLKLQKDSLKKLVIDLRQNGGGYLDAAVNIADELLSDNKLIVYTQGAHYPRQDYTCNKPGVFEKGQLAILVDGGSASASEILSGAVQDWDRGTIIGRRTFGKGLVQEQYNLSDGGALRLTVARYYMPSGRCIQRPYEHGTEAYYDDLLERYAHGELSSADSIHFSDTTAYYTKIKHRRMYGGGGIMPDIFVPIDTTTMDTLMSSLYASSNLFDFAYTYYGKHIQEFAAYKSADDFNDRYTVSDALLDEFRHYVKAAGGHLSDKLAPADKQEIMLQIKALFAREKWQTEGYYKVLNTRDRTLNKAIDFLEK